MKRLSFMAPALLALLAAAGPALAHPGHAGPDTVGLLAGLLHPLGADHLLAMLAVGLWSAVALPLQRRLQGPAAFLGAMLAGAVAGRALGAPGLVEPALALSLPAFGLLIALPRLLPAGGGLALVLLAGALHGLAHGAEAPAAAPFAGYAFGFVATTALLHVGGLALGRQLAALPQRLSRASLRVLAGGLGAAGCALLLPL